MVSEANAHGSARWAKLTDLHQAEWLENGGVTVGHGWQNTADGVTEFFPIQYDGEQHLATFAPNRTGKGTCAIIPALMDYRGAVLCIDPKGENAHITAKYRAETLGQKVELLDPWNIVSGKIGMEQAGLNPIDILDPESPHLIDDTRMLADSIVVETGGDQHWPDEAKDLMTTFILHVATAQSEDGQRHLGRVRDILSLSPVDLQNLISDMAEHGHRLVKAGANRLMQKSEKELQSVVSTANSNTHFLDSSSLRTCLEKSTFDFADLKNDDSPITVYCVIPADRLDTHGRWLRLVVSMAIKSMSRTEGIPKRSALFILDEFAAIGRLAEVEKAFGLMAGFGMRIWVILQDLSQLQSLYKNRWQTFIANAGVVQAFGTSDLATAEYLSKLVGVSTQTKEQGNDFVTFARPLMTPDEIMRMPNDRALLFLSEMHSVKSHKVPYWTDAKYHQNTPNNEPLYNPLPQHKHNPEKGLYDPETARQRTGAEWVVNYPVPASVVFWRVLSWPFRKLWQAVTWPVRKLWKPALIAGVVLGVPFGALYSYAYTALCQEYADDYQRWQSLYDSDCKLYDDYIRHLVE